jgi:hypothetical protein
LGEVQASQVPESIRHSKVADASPVNENEAAVELTNPLGPVVIEGAAGVTVSTVQVRLVGSEVLLAGSLWRTSKVCEP